MCDKAHDRCLLAAICGQRRHDIGMLIKRYLLHAHFTQFSGDVLRQHHLLRCRRPDLVVLLIRLRIIADVILEALNQHVHIDFQQN